MVMRSEKPTLDVGFKKAFSDENKKETPFDIIQLRFANCNYDIKRRSFEMNDIHSLSHTKWNCNYHIVFAPKYRRKVFFEEKRQEVGTILRELCKWKDVI
jgi:hypothetical protein